MMARLRHPALLAALLLLPITADAQQRPQQPAAKPPATKPAEQPAPESTAPPYEPQLLQLSEIMGSLAYLRTLCGGREAQDWRTRMAP